MVLLCTRRGLILMYRLQIEDKNLTIEIKYKCIIKDASNRNFTKKGYYYGCLITIYN